MFAFLFLIGRRELGHTHTDGVKPGVVGGGRDGVREGEEREGGKEGGVDGVWQKEWERERAVVGHPRASEEGACGVQGGK